MNPPQKIEISWTSFWRFFIFCALAALIYFAWDSLSVLLVGVMVSMGIEPLVSFLAEKLKFGRVFGAILVVLVLVAIFAAAVYLIMPIISANLPDS